MNTRYTIITSMYKGYCSTCQFSYFKSEKIRYNGKGHHLNCSNALTDKAPRTMNPKYKAIWGDVSRKKMRLLLDSQES